MGRQVNRSYHSPLRKAAAEQTRRAILGAARRLLVARGWASTTMTDIAREAGVALDTVYASVGRKPEILLLLIETAITGTDNVVTSDERGYVRRIQAATTGGEMLAIYAKAIVDIQRRMAPIFQALDRAASEDPASRSQWDQISSRRRRNMGRFADALARTGDLRPGLSRSAVADNLWLLSAPEPYLLLVGQRGWSHRHYERWVEDTWTRLLLRDATGT